MPPQNILVKIDNVSNHHLIRVGKDFWNFPEGDIHPNNAS